MVPVSGARLMLAEGKYGMRRMDANGDGVIDAGEHQGHQKRGKCRMQQDG